MAINIYIYIYIYIYTYIYVTYKLKLFLPNLSFLKGVQGPVFPQHNNLGSLGFKDGVVHLEEHFGREGYHPNRF